MSITKTNIIQALGGLIVGNGIFNFFALVAQLVLTIMGYFTAVQIISQINTTNSSANLPTNIFPTLSTTISYITNWTLPVATILWLVWLCFCFSKFNETETPKVNLVGVILHYILGMIFLIPLLYLPHRHYKKLFVKATGKDSKLLLIWQILNILVILPIIATIVCFLYVLFFISGIQNLGMLLYGSLSVIVIYGQILWVLIPLILLLNFIQTILGLYFVWQISTKL